MLPSGRRLFATSTLGPAWCSLRREREPPGPVNWVECRLEVQAWVVCVLVVFSREADHQGAEHQGVDRQELDHQEVVQGWVAVVVPLVERAWICRKTYIPTLDLLFFFRNIARNTYCSRLQPGRR